MSKIFLLLLFLFAFCESKKILGIFPTPSVSHQVVFRPLMIELAKRGHEVTVITPDPAFPKGQAPSNLTEIDVHDLSYRIWKKFLVVRKGKTHKMEEHVSATYHLFVSLFEEQMKSNEVQALLNNSSIQFDLLFTEAIYRPSLGFAHKYKVPVIEFSSFGGQHGNFETIGAATNPLMFPLQTAKRIHNLNIWEKLYELYKRYYIDYNFYRLEQMENEMLRRIFGSDMPGLNELKSNVKMLFLNVHSIWDLNRPVPPGVLYLGGLHQNPSKDLPKDLKRYLDSSKNGVIYVSFGTNMRPSLLPPDKLKIFTKVFSELPYDILWKWDVLDYPDCPKNVKIATWFPQSDLLKHPNIKLFVTQGGLQSLDETLSAGVPVVTIPMLWDQWFNGDMCTKHEIGIKVLLETLTEEELKSAITTILNDESYRDNMKKLGELLRDQPMSPLERAVWWTEHVLRTGGDHLRSPSANISWADYYNFDLISIFLAVCLLLTVLTILTISYILSKLKNIQIKIKTE